MHWWDYLRAYKKTFSQLDHIRLNGNSDQLVWRLRKKGDFTVKSYHKYLIRGEGLGTIHFPINQIRKTRFLPRIAFFAWKAA